MSCGRPLTTWRPWNSGDPGVQSLTCWRRRDARRTLCRASDPCISPSSPRRSGTPRPPHRSFPFALAFTLHVLLGFSPYVARLGGDTTSCSALVAALMGSVLGASAFRDDPLDAVEEVNNIDLSAVARELVALRPPAPGDPREQAEYVELEIAPSGPSSFEEPGSSLRTRQSLFEQVSPPTPLGPVRADAPAGASHLHGGSSCSTSRYAQLPSPRREGTCGPTMRGCA